MVLLSFNRHLVVERATIQMDAILDAVNNWYFIGGLILALLILIGIFVFMRMRKTDD